MIPPGSHPIRIHEPHAGVYTIYSHAQTPSRATVATRAESKSSQSHRPLALHLAACFPFFVAVMGFSSRCQNPFVLALYVSRSRVSTFCLHIGHLFLVVSVVSADWRHSLQKRWPARVKRQSRFSSLASGGRQTAMRHGQSRRVIHANCTLERRKLHAAGMFRGCWCRRWRGVRKVDDIVVFGRLFWFPSVFFGVFVKLELLRLRHKELFFRVFGVEDDLWSRRGGLDAGTAAAAWCRCR